MSDEDREALSPWLLVDVSAANEADWQTARNRMAANAAQDVPVNPMGQTSPPTNVETISSPGASAGPENATIISGVASGGYVEEPVVQPVGGVPNDGKPDFYYNDIGQRVIRRGRQQTVRADLIDNRLIVREDVLQEFFHQGSRRPSYLKLYSAGQSLPAVGAVPLSTDSVFTTK